MPQDKRDKRTDGQARAPPLLAIYHWADRHYHKARRTSHRDAFYGKNGFKCRILSKVIEINRYLPFGGPLLSVGSATSDQEAAIALCLDDLLCHQPREVDLIVLMNDDDAQNASKRDRARERLRGDPPGEGDADMGVGYEAYASITWHTMLSRTTAFLTYQPYTRVKR